MDDKNTYIVAEEDDDDHNIVIVSSTWLTPKKQEAFWPRFKQTNQYNKSLFRHEAPDDQTWQLITLKRKFYETGKQGSYDRFVEGIPHIFFNHNLFSLGGPKSCLFILWDF
jgi:hypothetical protein